jgi:hypothetical protein
MTYGYAAEKNSRQMQIARAYYDLRFADDWYDEPYKQKPKPNPATWIFRSSR